MKFALLSISLFFITPIFSQHGIGIQSGISINSGRGFALDEFIKIHTGFEVEGSYNYKFKNKLVLQTGLGYMNHGYDYLFSFQDNQSSYTYNGRLKNNIGTITIPMMIGYQLGNKLKFTPNVGLRGEFVTSANSKFPKDFLFYNEEQYSFKELVNPFNLSAIIRIQLSKKLGCLELFGASEYRQSLFRLFKPQNYNLENKVHLYGFHFDIGCRFFLNSKT